MREQAAAMHNNAHAPCALPTRMQPTSEGDARLQAHAHGMRFETTVVVSALNAGSRQRQRQLLCACETVRATALEPDVDTFATVRAGARTARAACMHATLVVAAPDAAALAMWHRINQRRVLQAYAAARLAVRAVRGLPSRGGQRTRTPLAEWCRVTSQNRRR